MEKKILEFNGRELYFTLEKGIWYVALKPICEALGIHWKKQHERISADEILGPVSTLRGIQIPGDQTRDMLCLPEKFVYGWLFQIQSDNPELTRFKWKCYEILYEHFEGLLTRRQQTLSDRHAKWARIEELELELEKDDKYKELKDLKSEVGKINKSLKVQDVELANRQGSFF